MQKVPAQLGRQVAAFLFTLIVGGIILGAVEAKPEVAQTITAQVAARSLAVELEPLWEALPTSGKAVSVHYSGPEHLKIPVFQELERGQREFIEGGVPQLSVTVSVQEDKIRIGAEIGEQSASSEKRIGGWLAIVPPLIAVLIALYFKSLIPALLAAVWIGGALGASTWTEAIWRGGTFAWASLTDTFNLFIILFTIALVGMVHVVTRGGGVQGIVEKVGALARTARSTRLAAFLMGGAVFFDDYANTFVVGTTMRPLTDAMRISREKLAYIVDSTSAPIAGLAVVSTWIGYEVGLFEDLSNQLGMGMSGYEIFFAIMPLRFYCIGALLFVLFNAASGRDFGPMRAAEARADSGVLFNPGSKPLAQEDSAVLSPHPDKPNRWQNAVIPVLSVIAVVFVGMFWSGWSKEDLSIPTLLSLEFGAIASAWSIAVTDFFSMGAWRDAFSNADNAYVLFLAASIGSVIAIAMTVSQRILSMKEATRAWVQAAPTMATAIIILILAWSIRGVCEDLGTSVYLVGVVQGLISPLALPLLTFLLAALVGFSTGTSWGTMGILLPAMVPLAAFLTHGMPGGELIVFLCFGAVLDGAIFGDHCSPISDTTVMSSIASGCDHMDHVKTQAPYASVTMILAGLSGYVGVANGLPIWAAYLLIIAGSLGILFLLGRPVRGSAEPSL